MPLHDGTLLDGDGLALPARRWCLAAFQMLTKTPKFEAGADRPDNKPSYAFDGPLNTTAQGNPVPLAYGKILAGSQVISAGLEAR